MSLLYVFIGVLIVLFLIGTPIPWAVGLTSVAVMLIDGNFTLVTIGTIAQKTVAGTNNFTLLAIPFFLLAAKLMNAGSITKKIFSFANSLVGWIPGGLGHANVVASIIFAGMSGAAVADASGLGTIEVEAMKNEGFDLDFSAAVTAASSTIGPIIPPSIPLVMFGVAGGVSISKLLIAGLLPGILMGFLMMVVVFILAEIRKYPKRALPKLKEFLKLAYNAFFPMLTPIILIGGIILGIFTPTEAAAVAALYAFILTVFIYRELSAKDIYEVLKEVARETAAIMIIVATSNLFGYLLIKSQIPNQIIVALMNFTQSKVILLLLINVFLLVVGCFMETNAAILILTPILLPITNALGVDPVQMGVVVVLNLMIGLLTPPIGMVLFATSRVAKVSIERIVIALKPFYVVLILALMLVTFVPQLSLFVPNLLLK
jgi:tripartite ATP-independent transporter DctM subunit